MSATKAAAAENAGAVLNFEAGWRQTQSGLIRQGEVLTVKYDPERLTACRGTYRGGTIWDLFANVRFFPSGETIRESFIDHSSPHGVPDTPKIVPVEIRIPADASDAEIWFQNTNAWGCSAFDSQFGSNYRFTVDQAGPTQPVVFRKGAIRSPEMVNVFTEDVTKVRRTLGSPPVTGSQIETHLNLEVWVKNVAYQKNIWIDLHMFDQNDDRVSAETITLNYLNPAGGGGDFFGLNQLVFQGSGGVPGGVWPRPDVRRMQYRVYYEVEGRVFTDGILHQSVLLADAQVSQEAKAKAA